MDKKKIQFYFQIALKLVNPEVTHVERTPGGMTNHSYFVTVNGEKYVIRIPGNGTEELIDRTLEKNNLMYGTEIGINPELIYFDIDSGVKITREIEFSKPLTPELAQEGYIMNKVISIFQRLHCSETVMQNRFDLFALMNLYEDLVRTVHPLMFETVAPLKKEVLKLKKVYESFEVNEAPCHIDTVPANIMLDRAHDKIYLIDWEYSGMFDPMWDIATFFQALSFTAEEELFFLKQYLGRDPNPEEVRRILVHKVFQDYLWFLWTIYKETKGDDFGSLAIERLERAMKNIVVYNTMYNYDNVV